MILAATDTGRGGFPKESPRWRIAALLIVLWIPVSPSFAPAAVEDNVKTPQRKNPHLEIQCGKCHAEIPKKKESDPNRDFAGPAKVPVSRCRGCHPQIDEIHHPVMKKADRAIPAGFPKGPAGEVVCSSCHDVHLEAQANKLLRGFTAGRYKVRMDLCLDCHAENYLLINPHNSPDGKEHCNVCHSSGNPAAKTDMIREGLDRRCDFCHDIRGKDHPANLNLLKNLPRWLTVNRTEKLLCAFCHDPHGTTDTIHFLRMSYVEFFEGARSENPHGKDEYFHCQACHQNVSSHGQDMKNNLLFGKDQILLCYSCHGEMDACHLVMIKMPAGKTAPAVLPLTRDGRITCSTCHDPTPAGGCNVEIRGIGPGEPISALCLKCHDKDYLSGINPHAATSVKTACRFCHAFMRDPDKAERFQVSFISNARIICLRCHVRDTHPMGKNIKYLVPRQRFPKPFRADRKNKVTCTTCHLHHFDSWESSPEKFPGRLLVEADKGAICTLCHTFSGTGKENPVRGGDQQGRSTEQEE